MNQQLASVIQAISGIASAVTALIAVLLAFRVERRATERFQAQLELARQTTVANVKPLLSISTSEFANLKSVQIVNQGLGTAVITEVSVEKDDRHEKNLAQLFEFDRHVVWDNFWTFEPGRRHYLRPGQTRILARLSKDTLLANGLDERSAKEVLDVWQEQLRGITINCAYEDVLGNPSPSSKMTFR